MKYELMKAMHTIICQMNDEDAYMEWINLVPDEATDEDLRDIAEDEELFGEACRDFRYLINRYGKHGFAFGTKAY